LISDMNGGVPPRPKGFLYLDHAATAWPKAPGVGAAMSDALTAYGSPGRGGHRLSTLGGQLVERVRQRVANLLGMAGSDRVVFTPGATYSLAFALQGLLKRGDHVIATSFDHSSVLRSLEQLRRYHGVLVTVVRHNAADDTLVDAVAADIRPQTRLICVNHASNVTGAILPCSALIELAHRQGAHVLVDASQSIGHVTFDLAELPADMVAFGGHKALLGPAGVGCLAIANPDIRLTPTVTGGTGYDSGNLDPHLVTPSSYEVGTLNVPAIAGLEAALVFREHGNPRAQQFALTALREDCIWHSHLRLPGAIGADRVVQPRWLASRTSKCRPRWRSPNPNACRSSLCSTCSHRPWHGPLRLCPRQFRLGR